jgi:hypothetical protein
MEFKDEGVCRFCLKTYSGRGMGRHLVACRAKKQQDREETANKQNLATIYHIRVSSYKPFWLHIEMQASATLADLDSFLRDIWLECCGHLSEFRINDTAYLVPMALDGWWDPEARSMDVPLQGVLSVKDRFEYEYDFGSTQYPNSNARTAVPKRQTYVWNAGSCIVRHTWSSTRMGKKWPCTLSTRPGWASVVLPAIVILTIFSYHLDET